MIAPHPRLKVNVAEQLAGSIVAAPHALSPNLVGANESRSPIGGERLFQQPARGIAVMTKRILSIDGGGIRGILPLTLLIA
ncbi:MAG: hypothetical protein WA238_17465, partial [Methylocella sp.]